MISDSIVSAITALAGALVGGLATYSGIWLQTKSDHRLHTKRLKIEKIEKTVETLGQIRQAYSQIFSTLMTDLVGKKLTDLKVSEPVPFEKLRMLVWLYFPGHLRILDDVEIERKQYVSVINEMINVASMSDIKRKEVWDLLRATADSMDRTLTSCQEALSREARTWLDS